MSELPVTEIIAAKRDGGRLEADEIGAMVEGFVAGRIPDYQIAAFLMAVAIRGMDDAETVALLDAVLASGDILDFTDLEGIKADKHSTGGVGDKISLILAPLAAVCGLRVPMISGRGLGHTGGTLDKLESICGFRTDLGEDRLRAILAKTGCFISGQTDRLVPADRIMYALRDVTATVPSKPLILASIVSKKIAEGSEALVFDVKTGNGAFMDTLDKARDLAAGLVRLCQAKNVRARALITDMNQPLGRAVGNALEVTECVSVLQGAGPQDIRELSLALTREMMLLAGFERGEADDRLTEALDSGAAYERFLAMVEAQGGDPRLVENGLPKAARTVEVRVPASGYISGLDAGLVGRAALALGAGRRTKNDRIDPAAGIILRCKIGDMLQERDSFATLHLGSASDEKATRLLLLQALRIGEAPPAGIDLVLERI